MAKEYLSKTFLKEDYYVSKIDLSNFYCFDAGLDSDERGKS